MDFYPQPSLASLFRNTITSTDIVKSFPAEPFASNRILPLGVNGDALAVADYRSLTVH
jgi:hypothetical protein